MSLSNSYATVAQFRVHMGDTGTALSTELAERALNASSRAVDHWCGRRFWLDPTVTVRYYKPTEDEAHEADVQDIGVAPTGLIVATDTAGDGTYATTWAATDYQLEPLNADQGADALAYSWNRIVAVDRYTFPPATRRHTLKVTARHGYSAIPTDVEEACLLKAASLFERRKSPTGMVSGISEFGVVRISAKDPDVVALLHPFVRFGVRAI